MEGREEREKNVKETSIDCLPCKPQPAPGIKLAIQICTLDRESNPHPFGAWANTVTTEHTAQGILDLFHDSTEPSHVERSMSFIHERS